MSFLYPLFLLAGLTVVIPVVIHLFNLRRYKTVYFPNTRFLKNIELHSQKQSQLRYKWLLALRILFLLSLILAFAQPFFQSGSPESKENRLQLIYLDNSSSMSVKRGARNLLDLGKEAVRKQLQSASPGARFILLTNERPGSYQPAAAEKVMAELDKVNVSAASRNASHVFALAQGLVQTESAGGAELYYYSDFQRNSFPSHPDPSQLQHIHFYGMPLSGAAPGNIFVDTAFLTAPVLQSGQSNHLVVTTRLSGKAPKEMPVLQLSVNGQVKSAATLRFSGESEKDEIRTSTDTLSFQVNGAGWQKIALTADDAALKFDDTFRISARSASNLSVLVLNEQQPNPYIQAAFRAYNGFRMDQKPVSENADWNQYNLIILNGMTRITEAFAKQIANALQNGQSVCVFPGSTRDPAALNEGLSKVADIRITSVDTAVQTAASLQQGCELVRDLFERIPGNVQLPVAYWHYQVSAGLSANQQSILSFRNGDPFLAQYTPSRGKLYLLATSADLQSGNFPGSYFFVPFLYQMTAQSKGGDVYAVTAGRPQPVFLPMTNTDERNIVHAYSPGIDLIPPQRPSGGGLDVFLGQVVQQPGFYTLTSAGGDTTLVALNQDRQESRLEFWDLDKLRSEWKGPEITWLDANTAMAAGGNDRRSFPLWKVCIILALLMLAAESFLLAGGYTKKTVAPR